MRWNAVDQRVPVTWSFSDVGDGGACAPTSGRSDAVGMDGGRGFCGRPCTAVG